MRARLAFVLAAVIPLASAPAQPVERVTVTLANFSFTPKVLHLAAGRPVTLHFVNAGSGSHNFVAPEFFAAATPALSGGRVDLAKGETRDVTLTPHAGHYSVRCTHFLHTTFGMTGTIDVS